MKKIFGFSYKLGKKILLLKNSNVFKMFPVIIFISFIILLRCVTNQLANQIISILFYIVIVLLEIILLSDKVLLSVKGFLEYGIFQYIQLLGVIILLLLFLNGEILTLVVFYIIVAFLWFGYSICVNNKVSTIVNELLSAALAILVLIKDLIVSALPTEILDVEYELPIIDNVYKYTGEQLFQLAFNCLVTPFLIINIIALLLCTVKGYWIDKYNDGKDITEDMLPDDIEQKDIIDVLFNRFIHRKYNVTDSVTGKVIFMIYTINQIREKSKHIFDKQDFVKEAYLFGSYARGEATENSDIDFMIVLNRKVGIEFFGLYHFLQEEFGKDVDVLSEREAYDIMPESIERDKVKIYSNE